MGTSGVEQLQKNACRYVPGPGRALNVCVSECVVQDGVILRR